MAAIKHKDSNGVWQTIYNMSGIQAHVHGNISNDGKVGTAADRLLGTGADGAVEAKTAEQLKALMLDINHPIGSVYISAVSTSPATLFGGTWAVIAAGTFLAAAGTGYASGDTGGAATHTHTTPNHAHTTPTIALTVANLPAHTHGLHTRRGAVNYNYTSHTLGVGAEGTHTGISTVESPGMSGTAHGHGNTGNAAPTTNSASSLPPYKAYYMWERTA